ncbi:hypothetical protein TrCOL_g2663 [Triparma columacea]|uniref:Hexosyltransferase n=1 Tax=Triparma columacea TaxID=722753 RepID=A0A9W7GBD1_9STRA|nr:hypothetical protein TrCOL_g2663 [Triparma columacea]
MWLPLRGALAWGVLLMATYGTASDFEDCDASEPQILLLVNSACDNMERRRAIVETWGSNLRHVDLVFSIGRSERCDDFTVEDLPARVSIHKTGVEDVYRNNILKLMQVLTSMDGITEYDYIVKLDDDVYVDEASLFSTLLTSPRRRHYRGLFFTMNPIRDPSHKNHVTERCMPLPMLPPFAYGAGYILSQDLVEYISSNAELLREGLIRNKGGPSVECCDIDDVQVGLWMFALGVQGWNEGRFNGVLNCHRETIIMFDVPPDLQRRIHEEGKGVCNKAVFKQVVEEAEGTERAAFRKILLGDVLGAREIFSNILEGGRDVRNAEVMIPLIDGCLTGGRAECEELEGVVDKSIKAITSRIQAPGLEGLALNEWVENYSDGEAP